MSHTKVAKQIDPSNWERDPDMISKAMKGHKNQDQITNDMLIFLLFHIHLSSGCITAGGGSHFLNNLYHIPRYYQGPCALFYTIISKRRVSLHDHFLVIRLKYFLRMLCIHIKNNLSNFGTTLNLII